MIRAMTGILINGGVSLVGLVVMVGLDRIGLLPRKRKR